ncbi:MAG: D-amino acid dehydrogenase [Candidatus Wenzhouxiangella sp. M2_3B_020]
MHVLVLGAGIIGSTTALALTERGLDVTLVDAADRAGAETSHANGSGITPGHAEPWNPPGSGAKLFPALLRRDQPWRVRASALPGLSRWGLRFLRESSPDRYYANARHCIRLGYYAKRCLVEMRERHRFDYDQVTNGSLELYFTPESLAEAIDLRRRIDDPDIAYRRIDRDELVELEPALAPVADRVHGTLLFPDHESGDACAFSRLAAEKAGELGADVRLGTRVRRVAADGGKFVALETEEATIEADACVIAAGCGSPELLRPLGLDLPIYPVKGYSATIELAGDDPAPTLPILDLQRRFVTARLGPDRLRIAGLAEFAGHDRSIDPGRLGVLLNNAAELLPELAERIRTAEPNAWTGLRPMTPDGPPLIGPTPVAGLFLNTGHGAMGWTQACGSAELLADLVAGKPPGIDPAGLLPARHLGS